MLTRGFTLIELLVVIFIVGITISFTLIAFGDFGEKRRIIVAAEQFGNNIKLAQQQAILDASTLGVHIDKSGYQILRFQANAWHPLPAGVFHAQFFPKGLVINLHMGHLKPGRPAIIINSSGNTTAFQFDFGNQKAVMMRVINERGDIKMQSPSTVNSRD